MLHRTDPISGQALTSAQLIPNRTLGQSIRLYAAAVGLRPPAGDISELRAAAQPDLRHNPTHAGGGAEEA